MNERKIWLFMAYKGTGKDTFCFDLKLKKGLTRYVFAKPGESFSFSETFVNFAFADEVKQKVFEMYPGFSSLEFIEEVKDEPIFGGKSFRELCIKVGEGEKAKLGPNVWVDKVVKKMSTIDDDVVVTALRFPEELDQMRRSFPNLKLVRLFRSETSIPSKDDADRKLDLVVPDFLILAKKEDFEAACIYFPVNNFRFMGKLFL